MPWGMAVDAPSSHQQLTPSLPVARDVHPVPTFPAPFGGLKTHLPTCRLWYTQHLQIPVQKNRKNTPNTTMAQRRPWASSAPAAQRVWMLALTSVPWATFAGSSLVPSWGVLAASAKGFRLITRSSLSPASEIRGTARQQSKSLVRMRFTCRDGFRMCHGEEQQKDHVC